MNDQLRRLGALRAITTVIVAAAAAVLGLSLSGLSVGGGQEPAVATVRPQLRAPATSALATGAHNARSQRRSRAAAPSRPQRKRCRPVDGVTFTVSVGTRCPKPLKGRPQPRISARLRKAASRPRVQPAPVKGSQTSKPTATTTTPGAQPKPAQPQPTATLPAKQPSTVAPPARATPQGRARRLSRPRARRRPTIDRPPALCAGSRSRCFDRRCAASISGSSSTRSRSHETPASPAC